MTYFALALFACYDIDGYKYIRKFEMYTHIAFDYVQFFLGSAEVGEYVTRSHRILKIPK